MKVFAPFIIPHCHETPRCHKMLPMRHMSALMNPHCRKMLEQVAVRSNMGSASYIGSCKLLVERVYTGTWRRREYWDTFAATEHVTNNAARELKCCYC